MRARLLAQYPACQSLWHPPSCADHPRLSAPPRLLAAAAQNALVQALQTLALLGNDAGTGGVPPPPAQVAPQPAVDLNNLAALLQLESAAAANAQLGASARPQVGTAAARARTGVGQ